MQDTLRLIGETGFSQFPVYEGGTYAGRLLTTNSIALWVAARMTANGGLAESEPISNVLEFGKHRERALVMGAKTTTAGAILALGGRDDMPAPLTLLLMKNGSARTGPVGLILAEDLPRLPVRATSEGRVSGDGGGRCNGTRS